MRLFGRAFSFKKQKDATEENGEQLTIEEDFRDKVLLKQIDKLLEMNTRLEGILNVSRSLMTETDLIALVKKIMNEVTVVMGADRSTLFLLDDKKYELWSLVAQGENMDEIRIPVGTGIAGYVVNTGETVNIRDAYQDSRFDKGIDMRTGFRTQSILCKPLRNSTGKIIGATEVLNKRSGEGHFTNLDEDMLDAFSAMAGISIENALVYEEIRRAMKTFEKFVPAQYLNIIAREGLDSITIGSARQKNVSILFSDIRDFTELSESISANETLNFLNSYMERMARVIDSHNGFVDKFIGDAILAVFDSQGVSRSVDCAVDMQRELDEYNRHRKSVGYSPIKIGIGVNTGEVIIGTIGTSSRMDSTVIGDTVNIASRLEGLSKIYQTPLLISEYTFAELEKPCSHEIREIDTVILKGKIQPVTIYEVYTYNAPEIIELKRTNAVIMKRARDLFRERRWDEAGEEFRRSLDRYPDEAVAAVFLERCLQNSVAPPPDDWDGFYRVGL